MTILPFSFTSPFILKFIDSSRSVPFKNISFSLASIKIPEITGLILFSDTAFSTICNPLRKSFLFTFIFSIIPPLYYLKNSWK